MAFVALLAEGVDRNQYPRCHLCIRGRVALLAEGVDRNPHKGKLCIGHRLSPSSRRAWIEISALL